MSDDAVWPATAATVVFSLVLAGSAAMSCGEDEPERAQPDGGAAGTAGQEGGGAGGSPASGGSAGTAGIGWDDDAGPAGSGGSGGSAGYHGTGDPSCSELYCPDVAQGQTLTAAASVVAKVMTLTFDRGPSYPQFDSWGTVTVTVNPMLGTVAGVTIQGTSVVVTIDLLEGTPGGAVTVDGEVSAACYYDTVCPVHREFSVSFGDGGAPEIAALNQPAQESLAYRPEIRLTLVEASGNVARVCVEGVPRGAEVAFDSTEGSIERSGSEARWTLPERPGLYQIEAMVTRGPVIATQALAVELRASRRS